jgi:hypothetical protein
LTAIFRRRNFREAVLFYWGTIDNVFSRKFDFRQRLSSSDAKRNHIIHRGETATEDEARQAIALARRVVEIMNSIPVLPLPLRR